MEYFSHPHSAHKTIDQCEERVGEYFSLYDFRLLAFIVNPALHSSGKLYKKAQIIRSVDINTIIIL